MENNRYDIKTAIFNSPYKQLKLLLSSSKDNNDNITPIDHHYNNIKDENLGLAIRYAIIAHIIFVFAGIHQKILSTSMNFNKILMFSLFRQLGISITAMCYLKYTNEYELKPLSLINIRTSDKYKELKWFIVRSFFLIIGAICIMYGIMNIKQMNVILLINLCPLIKNLVAPYFINQKFRYQYLIVTMVAFIGIIIMILGGENVSSAEEIQVEDNNSEVKNQFLGTIVIIFFAFTITITNFSIVILNQEYDSYNLSYVSSFWAFIIGFVMILLFKGLFFMYEYFTLFIILNGLLNGTIMCGSYVFLYHSYVHAEVQKTAYLNYIQIPVLTLFAYVFYNETINIYEVIGASVLLGTVYYTSKYIK